MIQLIDSIEQIPKTGKVFLYKHSKTCGISKSVERSVVDFAHQHPNIPIYQVTIQDNRQLSQTIEQIYNITHESPQMIVLEDNKPVDHTSHFSIDQKWLEQHL